MESIKTTDDQKDSHTDLYQNAIFYLLLLFSTIFHDLLQKYF